MAPSIAAAEPECPGCRQPLDDKGRCWRCSYRRCKGCGKDTGSAFIRFCILCVGAGLDAEEFDCDQ